MREACGRHDTRISSLHHGIAFLLKRGAQACLHQGICYLLPGQPCAVFPSAPDHVIDSLLLLE